MEIDIPWMIFKEGWNLGLAAWRSRISVARPSRIFLAMAVPSILVAGIATVEVDENNLEEPVLEALDSDDNEGSAVLGEKSLVRIVGVLMVLMVLIWA